MKAKVLIIEDDTFLGDVLVRKLSSEGFQVLLSREAEQGLNDIISLQPDIVLLDIVLPKMNGYELLEKKRNDPRIQNIPVIIISNSGQQLDIEHARSLGAQEYLIKADFDPDEVVAKVRKHLAATGFSEEAVSTGKKSGPRLSKGTKVTIVEDDKLLSDLLSKKLTTEGCTISHAIDGSEALKIIKQEMPDIIVLDILLPGMDGFEVLKILKSDEELKGIPVLLLSNLGQDRDIEKGRELGAAGFLVKATVSLEEIMDELQRIQAEHTA